jgi:hypothetical protein
MASFDSPMDKGTKVDQIQTSMCEANVGKKNGPGVHSYSGTFNSGGSGGSNKIVGPGVEGQYPIKSPKETKL